MMSQGQHLWSLLAVIWFVRQGSSFSSAFSNLTKEEITQANKFPFDLLLSLPQKEARRFGINKTAFLVKNGLRNETVLRLVKKITLRPEQGRDTTKLKFTVSRTRFSSSNPFSDGLAPERTNGVLKHLFNIHSTTNNDNARTSARVFVPSDKHLSQAFLDPGQVIPLEVSVTCLSSGLSQIQIFASCTYALSSSRRVQHGYVVMEFSHDCGPFQSSAGGSSSRTGKTRSNDNIIQYAATGAAAFIVILLLSILFYLRWRQRVIVLPSVQLVNNTGMSSRRGDGASHSPNITDCPRTHGDGQSQDNQSYILHNEKTSLPPIGSLHLPHLQPEGRCAATVQEQEPLAVIPSTTDSDPSANSTTPLLNSQRAWQQNNVFSPVTIAPELVHIDQVIRRGMYAQAAKGYMTRSSADQLPVLIKTATKLAQDDEMKRYTFEAVSLKDVVHKYVFTMQRIAFSPDGVPRIIYPFVLDQCTLKHRLLFARNSCSSAVKTAQSLGPRSSEIAWTLTTPQLVLMAAQVARGCRHLAKLGIVHKDVAARNCVVTPNLEVRVTDSALSCDLFPDEYHYHYRTGNQKVPLKWMPIETIQNGLFTSSSDVWSFGVTVWEIMTLGRMPYENINELQLTDYLWQGNRLEQPHRCPEELFKIMARCWALSPEDRINFHAVMMLLYSYAQQLSCYI